MIKNKINASVYSKFVIPPFVYVEGCGGASIYDAPALETQRRVKASITFTRICGLWHISNNIVNIVKIKITKMWHFVANEVAYDWKTKTR